MDLSSVKNDVDAPPTQLEEARRELRKYRFTFLSIS